MNFKLKNVALYAKGWYKKSEDIWADLKLCLVGDDYTPFTNSDVLCIIIPIIAELNEKPIGNFTINLISETHPSNCWKYGYTVKGTPYSGDSEIEYDYHEAVLRYFLSELKFTSMSLLGMLPLPSDDVMPLSEHGKARLIEMGVVPYLIENSGGIPINI